MLALELFNYTWMIGLAAFGVHLVLVGRLLAGDRAGRAAGTATATGRPGRGTRLLGAILTVAGATYVFDTVAYTALTTYADHADTFLAIVAGPSVLAELAFTLWLLHQGFGRGRIDSTD